MKIAVVGTGYVGLVLSVGLAYEGHQLICVDKDQNKIESLKRGIGIIYEKGLENLLKEVIEQKRISFTTDLAQALGEAEAVFIAVGTPQGRQDGKADLSFIYEVAHEIAKLASGYKVIITKSTVPVGTARQIKEIIKQTNPRLGFSVVSNPEFLREGVAIEDFLKPDRIIIGSEDSKAQEIMAKIYQPFSSRGVPMIYTDLATAELTKYAANSFLATKICFVNEMADLCEKAGADVRQLVYGLGLDPRIGNQFLKPGPGFGGSCFPKDLLAIKASGEEYGVTLSIIEAVIASNQKRKLAMAEKIALALGSGLSSKALAIFGLTFKADTDDVRDSPSLVIIQELLNKGLLLKLYDPKGLVNARKELGDNPKLVYCQDAYQAAENTEAIAILTEWEEFKELDLIRLKKLQKRALIIDLRNIMEPSIVKEVGFEYISIGK